MNLELSQLPIPELGYDAWFALTHLALAELYKGSEELSKIEETDLESVIYEVFTQHFLEVARMGWSEPLPLHTNERGSTTFCC